MNFNSIKVRLELDLLHQDGDLCDNFNSIKVRLELVHLTVLQLCLWFQFHKGTIRTQLNATKSFDFDDFNSIKVRLEPRKFIRIFIEILIFQFHKGTIRTVCCLVSFSNLLYFNSIKVRLELSSSLSSFCRRRFQFHKGTIRTSFFNFDSFACWISIP